MAQIVSIVLGFLYLVYVARYLGVERFGTLSFALAFAGIFTVFSELGLSQLLIREVARDKTLVDKYVGNELSIRMILSFFTLLIICIVITISNYPYQTKLIVIIISLSYIVESFNRLFYSIYQAYEKMEFQSIGLIINTFFLFVGAIVGIYFKYDVFSFAILYLIVSFICLIYNLIISSVKFTSLDFKNEYLFWKKLIKESLPFGVTSISIRIYVLIDTIMLSILKGDETVGWYSAAYRLVLVLLFIPIIANNCIFPLMSQFHLTSKNSLQLSFEKLFKCMMFIALPLLFGTLFIAHEIILLVYGEQFFNSVIALQILICSLFLIFIRSAFERLLESINKQLSLTKIFITGAFFNIFINLILIPKYSYIGAGIATVLTDLIVFVSITLYTKKIGYLIPTREILNICKMFLACIPMVVFLINYSELSLLLKIFLSALIYFIVSIILWVFDEKDMFLIKSIFNREEI